MRRHTHDLALLAQTALIVLPVAALSVAAFYSLGQDKASIERDARQRAAELALDVARNVASRAGPVIRNAPASTLPQGIIVDNRIESPPDYSPVPEPPDHQTPAALQANAEFEALLKEAKSAPAPAFAAHCVRLAKSAGDALTASGAPVGDLALLLALRANGVSMMAPDLESALTQRALQHPSLLTPEFWDLPMGAMTGRASESWRSQIVRVGTAWQAQESLLAMMRKLRPMLARSPRAGQIWLWNDAPSFHLPRESTQGLLPQTPTPVLALCNSQGSKWTIQFATSLQFEKILRDAMERSGISLPPYLSAVIEIGGQHWGFAGKPYQADARGRSSAAVLASAQGIMQAGAPHPFQIELDLADPDALFQGYQRRTLLTAGLITCAAAAAMLGLAGIHRNSRRQAALGQMKSNFVSSVSHELRAPIAAVRLMAESLDRGTVTDEAKRKDYFRLIVQECRRLSSLIENVLDFSRIDQGRKQYRFEPVDMVALARQSVALMEPNAAERQVRLVFAEPPAAAADLHPSWDAHAIEQSLVNLLDNAIKHSPPGAEVKVSIDLWGGPGYPPDSWVRLPSGLAFIAPKKADGISAPSVARLWVEDHGEGIPREDQARIFDLFYRRGSELRRETPGAGIGLSIVKHVAEAHGGRVIVESAPGEGSRFALELPLAPKGPA